MSVRGTLDFSEIGNLNHIGMLQKCGQPGLPDEHANKIAVIGQMGQYLFYRNGLTKTVFPKIVCKVEFRHASLGNFPGRRAHLQH